MSTLTGAHATPRRSLDTAVQKPSDEKGWISSKTFEGLPDRFKEAAMELQKRGEIVIGDMMMGQPSGVQENGIGTLKN